MVSGLTNFLTNIDLEGYTYFILFWGGVGILSAVGVHFAKVMPISSRVVEGNPMAIFGSIDKRTAWFLMESPILFVVLYFYIQSSEPLNASVIFIAAFVFHYAHRALIYPFRIKVKGKTMPILSMFSSMTFFSINGYLIGYYFGALKSYPWEWLSDPRFFVGMSLFVLGFIVNVSSDNTLINLRKPGESGYKIPRGGLFKYISCPNYFGEILEWAGFAIMTWCLPTLIYFIWVASTLIVQGTHVHDWYKTKFEEEYPEGRKAVIPFLV